MAFTFKPTTLVDLLHWRARHQPDHCAYIFLVDGETEERRLTYRDLDQRACAIAAWLQERGRPGDRALLLYPPGLEYITAFFGCLYAGVIAVPAYPPRRNRSIDRLQAIAADAQATLALTNTHILSLAKHRLADAPDLAIVSWLATDDITDDQVQAWRPPEIHSETLAFLQYTSGSTASPKGVMLSHANLLHNLALLQDYFEATTDSVGVFWLPPYHDMGLIGGILQTLYCGGMSVSMSPFSFLQRPLRWLQAISRYRATITGGPNFAYELCVHKTTPEQQATLDLSSWQVAVNGAESIRPETLDRFAATFAPFGFRRDAFRTCYGLAEATLFVSGSRKFAPPIVGAFQKRALANNQVAEAFPADQEAQRFVGCGQALEGQAVIIVDPESGRQCPAERIGEVWVSSPSVGQGYWNQPETTAHTFQAYLADTQEGPFLRTGDLGFIKDGELFITGRLKDLIIIQGHNYYPQDIELTVQKSHLALQAGGGAAFSVDVAGEERLVIVQEVERTSLRHLQVETVIETIRQAVIEAHEIAVYAVVLVKPGRIPKTSNGKIQRYACRTQFLAGTPEAVGRWIQPYQSPDHPLLPTANQTKPGLRKAFIPPRNATEATVAEIWAEVLGLERVGVYDNLFELGGHSLLATQIVSRVRETFTVEIPLYKLFAAPTIAGLTEQIKALCLETVVQPSPIEPVPRNGPLTPAFSQEWMWFIHQFQPASAAYHIPLAVRVHGPLKLVALEQSLNEVIRRHESLRTTIATVEGRPVQVIAPAFNLTIPLLDLRGLAKPAQEDEVLNLIRDQAQQPFDLSQGPLLRIMVCRLAEAEHVVALTIHHVIFDGWSIGVFARELITLYEAFAAGRPNPLPEPSLQYADFVHWQRQWFQGQVLQTHLDYWRQRLADVPRLSLLTDRPRPAIQTFQGALHSVGLDDDLFDALRRLSQAESVTLVMTLLAAFKTLLYRYTGQVDIAVGMPVANRHWLASEGLIGTLVNILVLRTDLSGDPSFRELLARVREGLLEAYAHQDLPIEKLVAELAQERELSPSPLFQVIFNYVNIPLPSMTVADLSWRPMEVDRRAAQFDLTLTVIDTEPLQRLSLEYNTNLFAAKTIDRMLTQFQTLLAGIVANPDSRLSHLPLITQAERHQLLVAFNQTQEAYPQDACIHQCFEAQVARTPETVAVIFGDQQLTYRALNARANQLAHYLKKYGLGPEMLVGVCLERSVEMLIALLGVLKVGGAYLPLDPTYPRDRLNFMLEEAQVSILLTQARFGDLLAGPEMKVICLDADWDIIAQEADENLVNETRPENLAYLIYTSGSTGQPKGVLGLHQGAMNRFAWMWRQYPFEEGEVCCQKTSLNFVDSVWEIFGPLLRGVPIVIMADEVVQDPFRLVETLSAKEISRIVLVPSLLRAILTTETDLEKRLGKLKYWASSGEVLPLELYQLFRERLPDSILLNLYGASEVAADVTCYDTRRLGENASRVPIGRPIANMQVYILDAHLQPLPIGLPGELYVGGVGLARGYLNRPALTAAKFIPHPFGDEPGARLYKTGDLARYLPNGDIEYLGRIDHQLKIRGFRIEPGEIEAALRQHPGVRQAVVTASEDRAGDKRLVAYILPEPDQEPPVGELRRFLRAQLPAHMVPATFMTLAHLPLTPNGKLDRRALPAPISPLSKMPSGVWGAGGGEAFIAPRGPLEERLAALWCEVLGLERVGIHDNFFDRGGHSLLAVDLFNKIEQLFGEKLPLATLFEAPTIAQLAGILSQADRTTTWSSLVAIQPAGTKPPFFFVHAHGGNVIGYYDLARRLGPDQPFYGLQAQGLDGNSLGSRRFEAIAAQYIEEIRILQPQGPYFLGGWCLGGNLAYEMAQQLRAQGEEVALLVLVQSTPPSYPRYLPRSGQFRRLLYRLIERIDLEISNFLERERGARWSHLVARAKRVMAIIQVKGEKLFASTLPGLHRQIGPSPAYAFAALEEAHLAAYRDYKTQPYQGGVALFRARKQPLGIYPDPKLGWGELIEGNLEVYELPGHQIGLLSEPRVRVVAEYLRACLEKARNT